MKKLSKKARTAIISTVAVVLVAAIAGTSGYLIHKKVPVKPSNEVEQVEIDTKTAGTLRMGVISDTQLPPNKKLEEAQEGLYRENLKKAFELLKTQNVDAILHVGDIGDMCSRYAYETYLNVFHEVFPDENTRPYEFRIMGNHDTWFDTDWSTTPAKHKLYQSVFKENPNRHLSINGFHFICASPDNTGNADGYSQTMRDWMKERLAVAKEQTKTGNPIFLITHHNIPDTVYGGSDWGAEQVRQAATDFEQVVSISGHSHFSILDERSIDQNQLTAFTTQSLAYVDMERNMFNAFKGLYDDKGTLKYNPSSSYASAPARDDEKPMCLIMNITDQSTVVERWNIIDQVEEKADSRWKLTYPMERGNFQYRYDARAAKSVAPEFPKNASITYNPSISSTREVDGKTPTLPGVSFPAATNPDLVNLYLYELTNAQTGKTYVYKTYSDYYLGLGSMAKQVDWAIDPTLPSGRYTVRVYAYESFGKRSEPLTAEIDYTQPQLEIQK